MGIRVGLVGASGHWSFVVGGIDQIDGAEFVAFSPGCDGEDMARVAQHKAAEGAAVFTDYRKMLDQASLDVVGVNPFYYLHTEVAAEALQRGIPVFCEKPLALELDLLESLRRVQASSGTPVGMMLNLRYEPMFYTARCLVEQGVIGQPSIGYGQKAYKLGTRPSFYEKRETFGGLIPWVGIHAIDWFRWVSGCEFESVYGIQSNLHAPQYPGMEDNATCLFGLEAGGSAVMSFDFLRPLAATSHGDDRLRLVGSDGVIDIRWPDAMEVITKEGPMDLELKSPPYGVFADFIQSLSNPAHSCMISTEDAFRVTEISLKARDAADRQEKVEL